MAGPSQPEAKSDKTRIIAVGVILIIIVVMVLIYISNGMMGIQSFIWTLVKWILILSVLGLIVWVVMKLLQKPRVDLVAADRQNIIDAGILSKPPMIKDLYFTGDREHGEFRVGRIIGYCQIQSYKDLNKIASLTDDEVKELKSRGIDPSHYIIKEDCFIFKKFGFPFSIFEQPKVLRTLEDEHSQLVGDVKVYAVSMVSKQTYYWPNRAFLDIARIDHAVIKEAWRGQIHEFLKDMVAISQRSVGLDAEHRRELENRKLLKLPTALSEPESRQ